MDEIIDYTTVDKTVNYLGFIVGFVALLIVIILSISVISQDFNTLEIIPDTKHIEWVDTFCYKIHNPNSTANYRESWGSAYRLCMLNNL